MLLSYPNMVWLLPCWPCSCDVDSRACYFLPPWHVKDTQGLWHFGSLHWRAPPCLQLLWHKPWLWPLLPHLVRLHSLLALCFIPLSSLPLPRLLHLRSLWPLLLCPPSLPSMYAKVVLTRAPALQWQSSSLRFQLAPALPPSLSLRRPSHLVIGSLLLLWYLCMVIESFDSSPPSPVPIGISSCCPFFLPPSWGCCHWPTHLLLA